MELMTIELNSTLDRCADADSKPGGSQTPTQRERVKLDDKIS